MHSYKIKEENSNIQVTKVVWSKKSVDESYGLSLFLIYDFAVYLSGADIGMTKKLADGIQVGTCRQHHGGKSMARDMESHFFFIPAARAIFLSFLIVV